MIVWQSFQKLPSFVSFISPSKPFRLIGNRDFKIQRRGRQRERQKTIVFISKTTTLHVHRTYFYISFPVYARLRRENA